MSAFSHRGRASHRIVQTGEGRFAPQYRFWLFFWMPYINTEDYYAKGPTELSFDNRAAAEDYIRNEIAAANHVKPKKSREKPRVVAEFWENEQC